MTYRLGWLNHWSKKHESDDPRVIIRYTQADDGWFEHEYSYYFIANNDAAAIEKAREYVEHSGDNIEVWSLYNRDTKETIATEED